MPTRARRVKQTSNASSGARAFRNFVIRARRIDPRTVSVTVDEAPAGRMPKGIRVPFSAVESAQLRGSFLATWSQSSISGGRAAITAAEAASIGNRLGEVLFPDPVMRLFAASLASVVARGDGLRIRLSMDPELTDLPWEYICRPDRQGRGGMSGFLLLDPSISLVRQAADAAISMAPITGRQRLAFVGAFWEGKQDSWQVGQEFALLNDALAPVDRYIHPDFAVASDARALDAKGLNDAAVFHYAGHCDFDDTGRAFIVKELPTSRPLSPRDVLYIDQLAPRLGRAGARLAVMSACSTPAWRPWSA
jgi:hypothetical protein